jgi:nucleotide-binding universal stress UspA family protein
MNQNDLRLVIKLLLRMKTLFSKILVPIDGSEYSFNAAEYAIQISMKDKSHITLLSILPSKLMHGDSSGIFGAIPPNYFKKYKNDAKKWFNRIIDKIKKDRFEIGKIKTDVITTPLSIVSAIVEYADKDDMTLIIMGTRGITGFKRMLLGSVASGVVTYAHCPVLVIR